MAGRKRGSGDHNSSAHPDVPNKAGVSNWVEDNGGLPGYIRRVARHIMADSGYPTGRAIAAAVSQAKKRAAGGNRAAATAVAKWEAMKAKAASKRASRSVATSRPLGESSDLLFARELEAAGLDLSRPVLGRTERKVLDMASGPPSNLKGSGKKIETVGDVRRSAAAIKKLPEALRKKAAERVRQAARKIGPEAVKFAPAGGGKG